MKVKIITTSARQRPSDREDNYLDAHAAEVERFINMNDIQNIHHITSFTEEGFRGPREKQISTMIIYS